MNLLVVGCGSVGSTLAMRMSSQGHAVSIIDRSAASFEVLGDDFSGFMLEGNPIDQDFLRRAGIEGCDAVAAMTSSDNVNVMVSELAQEFFGVKKVLTRIYDPGREAIFAQFGLETLCPTELTVNSAIAALTGRNSFRYATIGGRSISLSTAAVPEKSAGKPLCELHLEEGEMAVAILHADGSVELADRDRNPTLTLEDRLVLASIAG